MKKAHFESFLADRYDISAVQEKDDRVLEGVLIPKHGQRLHVPIRKGIPRFAEGKNYADSFALQWNHFRTAQLDSYTGYTLSADRFWKHTKWHSDEMKNKLVLEVGSGAGRFTEVLVKTEAKIMSFDLSDAIDVNYHNNEHKGETFFFQGDISNIPTQDESFDFVFCYGVLQHTPDPEKAFALLSKKLKPGGRISIDIYHRDGKIRPWKSKYMWRPITTRIPPERLFAFLQWFIPKWLPFDTFIKYIPFFGKYLGAIVPCWNYFYLDLPKKMKVEWAIMDTFDALAPTYDIPVSLQEVRRWFETYGFSEIDVFEGSNGIVGNGVKGNLPQKASQTSLEWTDERLRSFWDHASKSPESYFTYQFGNVMVERLKKYMRGKKTALDYGCGTGYIIPHVLRLNMNIAGLDFSQKSVDYVNDAYRSSPHFHGAWLPSDLLKGKKTFEAILCIEVVEHLSDSHLAETFENMKHLLARDGVLIITTPHDEDLSASEIFCPGCEKVFHRWQHVRSWTSASLARALEQHGFQVVESFVTDFSASLRHPVNLAKYIVKKILGQKAPHLVCVAKPACKI